MPSYFYHLTFELYPTPNPTDTGATGAPRSDIWVPAKETYVFDDLPSHPKRERPSRISPAYRAVPIPPLPTSNTETSGSPSSSGSSKIEGRGDGSPSVIDCGASRIPAQARKRIEIVSERRWRERTKSFPPPPSDAAIRPQTAIRDWRFGRVNIESIDLALDDRGESQPSRETTKATTDSNMTTGEAQAQAGSSNSNTAAFAALELGPTLGGDGSTTRAECVTLPSKNTEVGWGVVHFYRGEEIPNLDIPSSSKEEAKDDQYTTLCIPAVPSYILPADFLGFVGEKWRKDVTHFRMVMTSRMSRYLVLIKFRDGKKAQEWQTEFNGKVFNSMVVCPQPSL